LKAERLILEAIQMPHDEPQRQLLTSRSFREGALYGRDDTTWDQLTDAGLDFLVERARMRRTTTYTELNTTLSRRTGVVEFDFGQAEERAAMGHLLGLIVERNYPTTNLMISALVLYLDANDAGSGFYVLAKQLGLLPVSASADAKLGFWVRQVTALHEFYGAARA
jgi:hypothetical protein